MSLYPYQEQVKQQILDGKSIILQAPTGAGKTRAALAPFIETFWDTAPEAFPKKCVYAVPMRVLANQFTVEHRGLADTYARKHRREICIGRQTGEYREDKTFEKDLTFATIDQVLSSWLLRPYSLSRRQGNLNAGAFVGSYLVFDEFHLFDPDSTLPTTLQLLQTVKKVSPFVLMTATFSAEMLGELADLLDATPILLDADDLAGIRSQEKERRFHVAPQPLVVEKEADPNRVLDRHNRRSIVIFNQVERAQRFYQALAEKAPAGTEIRLLHSRFRPEDRQQIEDEIRREFSKKREEHRHESMILVATQVIEVGLDVTCEALHTELAPAASVLQRAGRCARYQGESGDVYVYPVENDAPYLGKAAAQSERTLAWLAENQGRHLPFTEEQALINHAHGPTDRQILRQLDAASFDHREQVRALWRGEGDRGAAQRLIREIQSQSLIVHGEPEQLSHAPFAAESFSLHPGTIAGKFEGWQERAEDDWDSEPLPWSVCRLSEVEADEEANRPIEYLWVPVNDKSELWGAPLLAVHPALVDYQPDLGLTLYRREGAARDAADLYECQIPAQQEGRSWRTFYRRETYEEHIRLVYEAFLQEETGFRAAAHRLEGAFRWRPGLATEVAHVVIWLHDLGKLDKRWQEWARQWQAEIGRPHQDGALAHTDYDDAMAAHRQLDKQLRGKRPSHAVEGALAAVPFLLHLLTGQMDHPLLRAAFSAIARHHAPFSQQSEGYDLAPGHVRELRKTGIILPERVEELPHTVPESDQFSAQLNTQSLPDDFVRDQLLIDERKIEDICAYMLLVRTLRLADQKGTQRGIEKQV